MALPRVRAAVGSAVQYIMYDVPIRTSCNIQWVCVIQYNIHLIYDISSISLGPGRKIIGIIQ